MKLRCKQAAKLFNHKPFKADWIHYSLDMGLLMRSPGSAIDRRDLAWDSNTGVHAAAVARFLKNTPGLGKAQIGEYISKGPPELFPFHAAVLKEYVDTFHFAGTYCSSSSSTSRRRRMMMMIAALIAAVIPIYLFSSSSIGSSARQESSLPHYCYNLSSSSLMLLLDSSSDTSCYKALRDFLAEFKLPGESQCIGR